MIKTNSKSSNKKSNTKKRKALNINSVVKYLFIKIYAEQLPEDLSKNNFELYRKYIASLDNDFEVYAIVHDKDFTAKGFFDKEELKTHVHIVIRKHNKVSFRIKAAFNILKIREDDCDEKLWQNDGVMICKNFKDCIFYLTHETDKCRTSGKYIYDRENVFTNNIEELNATYLLRNDKYKDDDLKILDNEAYNLGLKCENFDKWVHNLPFEIRKQQSVLRTFEKSYNYGVDEYVKSNPFIEKLCVFCKSPPNIGKSYTCRKYPVEDKYFIDGTRNPTDELKPWTRALFLNDSTLPDILNIADDYACKVNRRNRDNPWFLGDMLVVMSNLSFECWCMECGLIEPEHIKAAKSRFCIVELNSDGKIVNLQYSNRGDVSKKNRIKARCDAFLDNLFNSIESYKNNIQSNSEKLNTEIYSKHWAKKEIESVPYIEDNITVTITNEILATKSNQQQSYEMKYDENGEELPF